MEPACQIPHVWNRDETALHNQQAFNIESQKQVPALSFNLATLSALLARLAEDDYCYDSRTADVALSAVVTSAAAVLVQPDQDPAYTSKVPSLAGLFPSRSPDRFLPSAQVPHLAFHLASPSTGFRLGCSFCEVRSNLPVHSSSPHHHHHHHHHQPDPRPYMTDCIAVSDIHTSLRPQSYYSSTVEAERDIEFVAASFSAPAAGGGRTHWSCRTSSNKRGRFESAPTSIERSASDARHLSEYDIISSLPTDIEAAPPPSYQEAVEMSFWGDLGKKWGEATKKASEGLQNLKKEFDQPPPSSQQASQAAVGRRQLPNQQRRPNDQPQSSFNQNAYAPAGSINDPYGPSHATPDQYNRQQPYSGGVNTGASAPYRESLPIPTPSPPKQYNYIDGPGFTSNSYTGAPPPPYSPLPATGNSSVRRDPDDALIDFLNKERNPLTQMGIKTDPKNDHMAEPMDAGKKKKGTTKNNNNNNNASKKKEATEEVPDTPIEGPGDDKSGGGGAGNGGDDKKDGGEDDKKDDDKKPEEKKEEEEEKKEEEKKEEEIKEEEKKSEESETVPPTPSESVPPTPAVEKEDIFAEVTGKKKKKKGKKGKESETVPATPAEEKPEIPLPDLTALPAADASAESTEAVQETFAPEASIDTAEETPAERGPEVTVTDSETPADITPPTTEALVEEATGEFRALIAENENLKTQINDAASSAGRSLSRLENRVSELRDEKEELQDRIQKLEVEVEESREMKEAMNQITIERGRLVQLTEEQERQIKEAAELSAKLKDEIAKYNDAEAAKIGGAEAETSKLRDELEKVKADFDQAIADKLKANEEKDDLQENVKALKLNVRDLTRKVEKTEESLIRTEKQLLEAKAAKMGNVKSRVRDLEGQLEQRLKDELAAKEERERLSTRVFELEKKVDESPNEDEYQELKESITAKDAEIEELKNQLAELSTKNSDLDAKILEQNASLKEMDKLQDAIDFKDAEIELQAGEIATLKQQISELETKLAEVDDIKAQLVEQEEALQTQKDLYDEASKELDDVRILYEDAEERLKEIEELKEQLDEAEKSASSTKEILEAEKAEMEEKISALETEKSELDEALQSSRDTENSLNDKIAELTSSHEEHVATRAALQAEKDDLESSLQSTRDAHATLETQLSAQSEGSSVFVEEINSLKEALAAAKADLAAATDDLTASQDDHDDVKASLEAAEADLAAATEKLTGLEGEVEAKIAEVTSLTDNVAQLTSDIEAKSSELDARSSELEEANAKIEQLEADLADRSRDLDDAGENNFNERLEEEIAKSASLAAEIEVLKANESREAPEDSAELEALRGQLNEANSKVESLEAEMVALRDTPTEEGENKGQCREHEHEIYDLNLRIEDERIRLDVTRDELTRTQEELAAYQTRFEDVEKQKIAAQTRAAETLEESVTLRSQFEEMEHRALEAEQRITLILSKSDYQRPRQTPTPPAETVDFEEKLRGSRQAFEAQNAPDADDPGFLPIPNGAAATTETSRRERRRKHRSAVEAEDKREKEKQTRGEDDERARRREERKKSRDVPDIAITRDPGPTEEEMREREREKRRQRRQEEREREKESQRGAGLEPKERHRKSRRASGSDSHSPEVVSPPAEDEEERRKRREKTRKSLLAAAAVMTAAQAFGGSGSRRSAPVSQESTPREREHKEHRHRRSRTEKENSSRRSRGLADTPNLSQGLTSDDPSTPVDEVGVEPTGLGIQRPDLRSLRMQSRHSRLMIGGYEYESPRIASVTTHVLGDGSAGSGSGEEGVFQEKDAPAKGWGKVRGLLLKRGQTAL
ncbi:hypothetical protein TWF694_001006 [Orbilia ellipsospora]|uniref:Uncharacterized protein n=1 Tax=Orbilia ellipsospora TaxID=2528407 RepID=A0AAV9XQT5_9PEZI